MDAGATMTQIADPATTATESSAPPLIDRPLAELMDWDSFRR
jgi:hypothetical protein